MSDDFLKITNPNKLKAGEFRIATWQILLTVHDKIAKIEEGISRIEKGVTRVKIFWGIIAGLGIIGTAIISNISKVIEWMK